MYRRILFLLAFSLVFTNCKKEIVVGKVMILNKGVTLHQAPFAQAKVVTELQPNQEYNILKKDIADEKLKNRVRWYLLKKDNVEGYLSYDNEKLRKDAYSYFKSTADAALITETAPMLALPDEKAKRIKKIQVNDLVDVLAIGQESRSYEENWGKWVQVKDKTGKVGFVFSANLMTGKHLPLLALKKAGYQQARGWLYIKKERLELASLPWDEILQEKEAEAEASAKKEEVDTSDCMPSKGQFVPVNAQMTHENKLYYHVQAAPQFNEETSFDFIADPPPGYDMSKCYSVTIEGWVLAKDHQLIDNFFEFSKKSADDIVAKIDEKLLALIVKKIGPHVNLKSLAVENVDLYGLKKEQTDKEETQESQNSTEGEENKIETSDQTTMKDDDEAFFIVSGYQGPATMFQPFGYSIVKGDIHENGHRYLVQQSKNNYRFLGSMPQGELIDLDSDSNPELVIIEQNRGGSYVAVYTFTKQGFKEVKGLDDAVVEMGDVQLVAPYILIKEYDSDRMKITAAFEFKKGKMRKVSKKQLKALKASAENTSG